MKVCRKCGVEKSIDNFHVNREKKDGYSIYCKECVSVKSKRYYQENTEVCKQRTAEQRKLKPVDYAEAYRTYGCEYQKKHRKKYNEFSKRYFRKYKYNLDHEQFAQMLKDQDHKCRICETDITESACVDHNHDTNEVRGLLCSKCNLALGQFRDSPTLLDKAKHYLLEKGHYGSEVVGSP